MTWSDPLGLYEGTSKPNLWGFLLGEGNFIERRFYSKWFGVLFKAFLFALIAGGGAYLLDHSLLRAALASGFVCLVYWRAWRNGRTYMDRVVGRSR